MGNFFCATIIASFVMLLMVAVYRWLLSTEKQPAFNRAVLLSIYGVALVSPLLATVRYGGADDVAQVVPAVSIEGLEFGGIVEESHSVFPAIVLWVYATGAVCMLIFTIITWIKLYSMVRSGRRENAGGYTLIVTDRGGYTPFSWLKYIVISEADYRSDSQMIILHESKHLALRHPLDLIVAQVAIIFLWYNPAAYLMRDELRNVHEYQADMAVIESGTDMKSYQLLLVKKALGKKFPALANSLNHSKLKSRIEMMMKPEPSRKGNMLAIALLPALAAGIAAVNIPAVASTLDEMRTAVLVYTYDSSEVESAAEPLHDTLKIIELSDSGATLNGKVIAIRNDKHPADGEKTSDGTPDYFINGTKVDNVEDVNPSEIVSMTVNKDNETPRIDIVTKKESAGKSEAVARVVETLPQYPGGEKKLLETLMANVHFPESEITSDPVRKTVVARFTVSSTGKVSDISVIRSQGDAFDNEAIKAIKNLDDFIPATVDGKPVASMYNLPVVFYNSGSADD